MDGMVMVELETLENYCNQLLAVSEFEDFCPNGIQLDAGRPVQSIVSAVTASQAAIEGAAELQADMLLVHHGYFWRGEPAPLVGLKGRRVGTLYRRGISLMAYHLPLDAHPQLGNNRLLAQRMGLDEAGLEMEQGGYLWHATLGAPESVAAVTERIRRALERDPLHLPGGADSIRRLGWCSGAAQERISQAAELGLDAFISGEASEQTFHLAQELGIHYFAAGHHATERFGVQALGQHLAEKFGLLHQFLDLPNPV
jgi:dinuclear metal center YbgI/SA1388 family protein